MILLDAYAVIAYLQADPYAGPAVQALVDSNSSGSSGLAITSVNAAEVVDHLVRVLGIEEDEAVLDLAELGLQTVDVDARIGLRAGLLRARHYRRRRCEVSLADCVAAAAVLLDPRLDQLCTADPNLLDIVHAERGEVVPLPGSDGSTWVPPQAD